MRVAAVQHDVVWEDPGANFERLAPRVEAAAAEGADLVVLAELFSTGFTMATDRTAEAVDGPSTTFLVDCARRHGVWVCGSVPARHPGAARPRNSLVLAAPDGAVHRYAKRHLFAYAGEDEAYESGDSALTVDVAGARVSPSVCFDLRFPADYGAIAAATDLYVVVASWPAARRHHLQALLVARAIENQAFVVGVNRVGEGGGLSYAGDSCVIDPLGEALAAAAEAETTLLVDIDPSVVADVRARYPFFGDRR